MERIRVEPRTPEWHAFRAESWTASAAATLVASENAIALRDYAATVGVTLDIEPLLKVGMTTFFENTLWSSWAEKTGMIPRFGGNEHTARGNNYEELVIRVFEEKEMMVVEREVTAFSSEYQGILASLDALAPQSSDPTSIAPFGFPVEAKCPAFVSRKKLWDQRKLGGLAIMALPYYWCQVQHQIYVAQAPYGWFVAAGVEEKDGKEVACYPIVEKIPRDDAFLEAYIAAAKFYHQHFLVEYNEPPKLIADHALLKQLHEKAEFDRAMSADNHEVAVDLYLSAENELKLAEARAESLKGKVLEAAARLRAAGSAIAKDGVDVVRLADRLEITFTPPGSATSWQKVSKEMTKRAGMTEIPKEVLDACQTARKESVKLKEIV
jgi:YqaJ-like viral recombinase domain